MTNCRLIVLFLALLTRGVCAYDGVWVMGPALGLTNQSNLPLTEWADLTGANASTDAAEGAYMGWLYENSTAITGRVELGQSYAAGIYYVFIKSAQYFTATNWGVFLGDGTNFSADLISNGDFNRHWTKGLAVTSSVPFTNIFIVHRKGDAPSEVNKYLLRGIYFTTNAAEDFTYLGYNRIINYTHPADTNASAALAGNWLEDSSFECWPSHGWGIESGTRDREFLQEYLDASTAAHGTRSLRNNTSMIWESKIFWLRGDRAITVSAYGKSTNGAILTMRLIPVTQVPAYRTQQTNLLAGFTLTDTWTRYSATQVMWAYPAAVGGGAYYRFEMELSTNAWMDAVQVEEGGLRTYGPKEAAEFGFAVRHDGNLFYASDSKVLQVVGFNNAASAVTKQLNYQVFDFLNRLVTNGSRAITCGASNTVTNSLSLPIAGLGSYRVVGWLDDGSSRDETVFGILPVGEVSTNHMIGTHPNFNLAGARLMNRLKLKYARGLSPGSVLPDWSTMEPTEGNFVWADTDRKIDMFYTNGVLIMSADRSFNRAAWTTTNGMIRLDAYSNTWFHIAARYTNRIYTYEFFNEPGFSWNTNQGAALMAAFVNGIKAGYAGARVCAIGGFHAATWSKHVWDLMSGADRAKFAAISMHAYPYSDGDSLQAGANGISTESQYDEWRAAFAGVNLPMENTEAGADDLGLGKTDNWGLDATGEYFQEYLRGARYVVGAGVSADATMINILRGLGRGFKGYTIYDLRLHPSPSYQEHHYTGRELNDGIRPKVVAAAIGNQLLGGATGIDGVTNANNAYTEAYLFTSNATSMVTIWSRDRTNRFLTLSNMTGLSQLDMMGNAVVFTNARIYVGRHPSYLISTMGLNALSNTIKFATVTNIADSSAPNLSIDMSPNGVVTTSVPLRFKWSGVDDMVPTDVYPTNVVFRWKLAGAGTWSDWRADTWFTTNSLPNGTYQLMVQTKDAANNTAEMIGPSFRVGPAVTTQQQGRLARARGRAR